jgi:hypothetical protein
LGLYLAVPIEPEVRFSTNSCDSFSDSLKPMREKTFKTTVESFEVWGKLFVSMNKENKKLLIKLMCHALKYMKLFVDTYLYN